ncbi:MAG: oligopeptide transporter, OPT family [Acidobacteriia bacterium]|nr:oligopeptide transporter, OPT family [Terriglobia bacterium]
MSSISGAGNIGDKSFKPYVSADESMAELSIRAVVLGILMAVFLGAANAYLGMKAGQTISAIFPAAVIAAAAFRLPFFRGTILEQNIARTAAAMGEALIAGAIFTIPAFLIVQVNGQRLWTKFRYWDSTLIMLVGGLLGVLFIILLRRTLVEDVTLPFPESAACVEIVKAGQKAESGAGYVFSALGIGALIELLKNSAGFTVIRDVTSGFIRLPQSIVHHFNVNKVSIGDVTHQGAMPWSSPVASPALMGVGYIIGPKWAAVNFSGGVIAWLVLIPLILFVDPDLPKRLSLNGKPVGLGDMANSVWYNIVRPIAVGAMLVGSINTLWGMRKSLVRGLGHSFRKQSGSKSQAASTSRLEKDLNFRWVIAGIIALLIPMVAIYYRYMHTLGGAVLSAIVLVVTGFIFTAVGGYLVGIIGGSNQPVSGLTLSALIVAALLMLAIGQRGPAGVAAVLGVAAVVCCAASAGGSLIQDLRVGHLLGGTPWKMQVAEMLSVTVISFVMVFPMIILHEGNIAKGGIGIGDQQLPAPQAGLMAQLAKGIVGGDMPWGLLVMGMAFAVMLILIEAPSPMLIAVGMYLPFETTFAIFVGGMIRWMAQRLAVRRRMPDDQQAALTNTGTLLASGFIAGEALMGVGLSALVLFGYPSVTKIITGRESLAILDNYGGWLSLLVFACVVYVLVRIPIRSAERGEGVSVRLE